MFADQRVLVTGSGRGIGKAIARRFAEGGARIQLVARSREELESTRAELLKFTQEVRATALDLLIPDAARQIVAEVSASWGGLDILVTNAGAAAQGGFLELEDDVWSTGFGLKMFANLRVIKSAWPLLKASAGHLVMIGGGTAKTPDRQLSLVSAVNGSLAALSTVNLVQPGMVKTSRRQKLFEKLAAQEGIETPAYIDRAIRQLRVTRLGEPDDVAELVAFLSTGRSRWMQGSIVDVDGGQNKGV
jgi:NAD(P)-dependent dehydrogenase (short-subunit alcohol dehydrogenase family)